MIERVARAICADYGEDWESKAESGVGLRGYDPRLPARDDFRDMARAAIAAMRDAPEDIVCVGDEAIVACLNDHPRDPTFARGMPAELAWRAMIDAALA